MRKTPYASKLYRPVTTHARGVSGFHMLLRQGLLMVAAGAIPGIAGARLTRRFLETLIDGAKPVDIIASVGLAMFLVLVASVSIYAASRPTATLDIVAIWRAD